jgi:hypothetical protein
MLNRPAISVDYEVGFTNNPLFKSDGTMVEETIDVNDMEVGLVDVKHTIDFSLNKRTSTTNFSAMMDAAVTRSPATVSGYYTPAVWPLKHIKKDLTWPNRKPKGARVVMQYNNHPRYFVTINGNSYRVLDYRVTHNTPVDMVSEYKIINRPNKLSIINYAYQTERGQLNITIDAGIGRNPDEFITSFRTDIGTHLFNLYQYATTLFFGEFKNQIPLAFTYYLEDVKYTYNSENGTLQLVTTFTYALKKYTR